MSADNLPKARKRIWVVGDAVQDITVEIDLERLQHKDPDIHKQIYLDRAPYLKKGLKLLTSVGSKYFALKLELPEEKTNKNGFYELTPGRKYPLEGSIEDNPINFDDGNFIYVPGEYLSWGGGGINLIRFLRSIAPNAKRVPITYSDIAMSQTLPFSLDKINEIIGRIEKDDSARLTSQLKDLYQKNPKQAEEITSEMAKIAAEYTPDRSLEVFISSLPADFVMYRPENAKFRRNWVFNKFHDHSSKIDDKIICRGYSDRNGYDYKDIKEQLGGRLDDIGLAVLNSIKNEAMFDAAYELCCEAYRNEPNLALAMAVTKYMRPFAKKIAKNRKDHPRKTHPPIILLMNEKEAFELAKQFIRGRAKLKPFMEGSNDYPDMLAFSKVAEILLKHFNIRNERGRIYVTLGSRGCLGVDGLSGRIAYLDNYQTQNRQIFDTNACGDAYAAGIILMEWGKRYFDSNISGVDKVNNADANEQEMMYFMAVACAAAYSKATSPRGRVDPTVIRYLLDHIHLAAQILPTVYSINNDKEGFGIRKPGGRIEIPKTAEQQGVKSGLDKLMSGIDDTDSDKPPKKMTIKKPGEIPPVLTNRRKISKKKRGKAKKRK